MKKQTIFYLFVVTIVAILFFLVLERNADFNQPKSDAQSSKLTVLGNVPNVNLVDQSGNPFSLDDLKGKNWIANFIFTRCAGPCPLMTSRMKSVQQQLKDEQDIRFVSFSVDPEYDRSEVLTAYAKKHGADLNQWSFLTGEKDEIFKLAVQHFYLGVGEVPPEEVKEKDQHIWHSTKFVLVNKNAEILNYYDSESSEALNQLIQRAKSLSLSKS